MTLFGARDADDGLNAKEVVSQEITHGDYAAIARRRAGVPDAE